MKTSARQESHRILVLGKIHRAGIERLQAAGGFEVIARPDDPSDLAEQARSAEAIIVRATPIDRALLAGAPRLRLVARHGVGYDSVDVDALSERGIPLALTGDVNSGAVAEHTLALMLALAKRIVQHDRAIREDRFAERDHFSAVELDGRRILVIGFGRIGRRVAALCRAFGMAVRVFDPFLTAAAVEQAGYRHSTDLDAALADADWVSLHLPKTPQTRGLIGQERLARMRPGAFLVNVARGGLVDEAALVEALDTGRLAGAGLDVFETEPLAPDHPLAAREDVVLSPHAAALTSECAQRMALACADNVIAFFAGQPDPTRIVNREVLAPGASPS